MPKALPVVDTLAPVRCAPMASGPLGDDDALEIAVRLKALADPVRIKVVSLLFASSAGDANTGALARSLGLSDSTVSHHLAQLRKAGVVLSDRRGMSVFHRVRADALDALCVALDPGVDQRQCCDAPRPLRHVPPPTRTS